MAIRLNLHSVSAHNGLVAALRRQGKSDQAIAEFRKPIGRDPSSPSAHANLGLALYQLHGKAETNEAVDEFRKAIELDPSDADTHAYLGLALISGSRSRWTSPAISCPATLTTFYNFSGEGAPTPDSRICWVEGACSINGTILRRRPWRDMIQAALKES
jgi:tetratricopeptide (TPR) repeat protein